jgi:hypothetical protein
VSGEIIIDGADRALNPTPDVGVLSSIRFPSGAVQSFTYESNTFLEPTSNVTITGGGLRIKKIQLHDGVSFRNDIIKEYEYLATSGNTSGRLLGLPSYSLVSACHIDPSTGVVSDYASISSLVTAEQWRRLIVRTSENINRNEPVVVYERVREKQQGAGSIVYEYELPNKWGDLPVGEWSPTYSHIARSTSCPSSGLNTPGFYTYPFAAYTPYDYARGLVKRTQHFAENEINPVKEVIYTYTDKNINGSTIKGLQFELIPLNATTYYFMYGVYNVQPERNRVVQQVVERIRDRVTPTVYLETISNYSYAANHLLPISISASNSDNTQYITKTKYVKDYTTGASGTSTDNQVISIDALLTKNRNNVVVEQIRSVIPSTGGERSIAGQLTLFENVGLVDNPIIVPSKYLSLDAGDGISSFVMSSIAGTSARTFERNGNYRVVQSVKHNSKGDLIRSESANRKIGAMQYETSSGNLIVAIDQAEPHEIIYSNFDNTSGYQFSLQGTFSTAHLNAVGRDNSKGLGQVYSTTRYLKKNLVKRPGSKYNLSLWYKPVVSTGTQNIVVTIKNTSSTTLLTSSFPVTNKDTQQFSLIEGTIDLSSIPNTEVIVEITYSGPTSSLGSAMSIMDDVLFYPADCEVKMINNGSIFGPTSEASTTGDYQIYSYNPDGQLRYMKDRNLDILTAFKYNDWSPSTVGPVSNNVSITLESDITDNKPTILKAVTACLDVATIEWKVEPAGTSSGTFFTGTNNQSYTFSIAGFYDVTARISHPSYGSFEVKRLNVEVKLSPLNVTICAEGGTSIDLCSLTPAVSETCGGSSSGISFTTFKINSISGCTSGATYNYRWQKRPNGAMSWAYYGDADTNLSMNNTSSYEIRCVVTSSCGRTGYSNVKTVTVYRSDSSCSQP